MVNFAWLVLTGLLAASACAGQIELMSAASVYTALINQATKAL